MRRIDSRPFSLLVDLGLLFGQAVDDQCEAARRREGARIVKRQAGLIEPLGDEALEVGRRALLHAGRNLLRQKL